MNCFITSVPDLHKQEAKMKLTQLPPLKVYPRLSFANAILSKIIFLVNISRKQNMLDYVK